MDLIRLDDTSFYPDVDALVEGYDSLIWTERFLEAGEFELHTSDIAYIHDAIPVDSLVSHRDTREVMIVESHNITEDDDGNTELVVKGRSLESFLEQRVLDIRSGKTIRMLKQYTSVGAAEVLVWNAFCNPNSGAHSNVITDQSDHDPDDRIPNTRVTESTRSGYTLKQWHLEAGYVYSKLLEILAFDDLGIRCRRPIGIETDYDTTEVMVVTVDTDGTGNVNRTSTPDVDKLLFNIYDGTDRTLGQLDVDPIVFSKDLGQLVRPEYLFTKANNKNIGFVTSALIGDYFYPDAGARALLTGLKRRVLFIDIGDTYSSDPDPDAGFPEDIHGAPYDSAGDYIPTYVHAEDKSEAMIKRRRNTFYFNCESSPDDKIQYKRDYFLGDKVTLLADYGVQKTAVVNEYIRTEDETGDRGYPTLAIN